MILERKEKIEYEPLKTESYADYQIEQRHRNADSGTLFDLGITASCLAATAATTGREARAHGNACHHGDDLLSELHLLSFIFEGMANPPWSPEPENNLRFIS